MAKKSKNPKTYYLIYANNEITNQQETYEIDTLECSIARLYDIIITIKFKEIWFGTNKLVYSYNVFLSDIGLGSESNIVIKTKEYSEDELDIIEEFEEEALIAYKKIMNMEDLDVIYDMFYKDYYGYFPTRCMFTNQYLEDFHPDLDDYIYISIDGNVLHSILMEREFIWKDGYYFWNRS